MSAFLGIWPKNVKVRMVMRLDEIGENYENLKAKAVSYMTNKSEQARGGQKEMHLSVEVGYVSGSEPEEEDWADVNDVRRGSTCYICGWDTSRGIVEGKGRIKGMETERDTPKIKGMAMKGVEKSSGKSGGDKGAQKGDTRDSVGCAVQSDTRHQNVDGKSLTSTKMPTAEEEEDNVSQRRIKKLGGSGSLGMWWNSRKRKKAPAEVPILVLGT